MDIDDIFLDLTALHITIKQLQCPKKSCSIVYGTWDEVLLCFLERSLNDTIFKIKNGGHSESIKHTSKVWIKNCNELDLNKE